jgi:hypothetical protein
MSAFMIAPVLLVAVVSWLPLPFRTPGFEREADVIRLDWTATGDDSTVGRAAGYDLRWAPDSLRLIGWRDATPVAGVPAPAIAGSAESFAFTVPEPPPLWFGLRVVDEAGNWSGTSNTVAWRGLVIESEAPLEYSVRGRDRGGYVFNVQPHGGVDQPLVPKAPGELDTLWLPFWGDPEGFEPEGAQYAISARFADGWREPFQSWHVRGGCRDTTYFRNGQAALRAQLHGALRFVVWALAPTDTAFGVVESQEQVQRAARARLCALFADSLGPYWALAGVRRRDCP